MAHLLQRPAVRAAHRRSQSTSVSCDIHSALRHALRQGAHSKALQAFAPFTDASLPAQPSTSRPCVATRASAADTMQQPRQQAGAQQQQQQRALICTSVTADSIAGFLDEIQEATAAGVDLIELRLDYIKEFNPATDLEKLMAACSIPYIVTYRPKWEGGNYDGPEPQRLATLKLAAIRGAPYVDVEYKAAGVFFAGKGEVPISTQVILSSHNFSETPPEQELHDLAAAMREAGADIVKIATTAKDICDSAKVLSLLQRKTGPTIALAMGEKGLITRLLAAKYGGHLTFAALSAERQSAPGQPTIQQLKKLYGFERQGPATKLFGIIGNPVHHSKSPVIHNPAFQHIGFDGVYVPLLVDDLATFLHAFKDHDFTGFSVTIPHKEAALKLAGSADDVASSIGAVNTLIRQPDGSFRGFNTDSSAALGAIEASLGAASGQPPAGVLAGKTFVVIGAGGAGRALAVGAAARGAKVVIANRDAARGAALAAAIPGGAATSVPLSELQSGSITGNVLANTTSVGMVPDTEASPVPAAVMAGFKCVFDAVYTPQWTRLLRDAREAGCVTVDGVRMFVGQAVDQFVLFTGGAEAPVELMERAVLSGQQQQQQQRQ